MADSKIKSSTKSNKSDSEPPQKVQPVNNKEYDEIIKVIDQDIKKVQEQIKVLDKKIDSLAKGKEEFLSSKTLLKNDMDAFDKKISVLENTKKELFEKMQNLIKDSKQATRDLKDMEKKIGFNSEAEVDAKIAELEYKMHTETLSLKREKELISQIAQLKQTKPKLKKMSLLSANSLTSKVDNNIGAIKAELEKVNKQLNQQRDDRRVLATKFRALMDDRKKNTEGLPELYDQRKALKDDINAKYGELRQVRDEKYQKIKEYQEYMALQRKIREENDEKYRAARTAEEERVKLAAELENEDLLPFAEEVTLIENSIKYCKGFLPGSSDKAKDEKAAPVVEVAGTVALVSKKDRPEEFFFNPTSRKKTKKAATKTTSTKPFKYDLVTMNLFQKLKIDAPMKSEDVPAAIQSLEVKLQEFKKKQQAALAERKAKHAEREAALTKATEKARIAREEADKAWNRASKNKKEV